MILNSSCETCFVSVGLVKKFNFNLKDLFEMNANIREGRNECDWSVFLHWFTGHQLTKVCFKSSHLDHKTS